jgi:site-specific DNA-cytosine methylase
MRVLVACEESQEVCKAFRARGHEAYSCDIQECSGGHPEWHYKKDVFEVINNYGPWDMMIAFPPCTYISSAGLHWCLKDKERMQKRDEGLSFFIALYNQKQIKKIAIENPVGYANTNFKPHTQIIEPYYFGDPHKKRTCLWLKNLPRLNGRLEVALNPRRFKPEPIAVDSTGKKRYFTDAKNRKSIDRSKTFPGIARAMAEQWG